VGRESTVRQLPRQNEYGEEEAEPEEERNVKGGAKSGKRVRRG